VKVDKVSVSFPPELGDAIRASAAKAGAPLSAWLAQAASAKLRAEALAELLDDWSKEDGPLTYAELAEARRTLQVDHPTADATP
jgi:hypothetical protein